MFLNIAFTWAMVLITGISMASEAEDISLSDGILIEKLLMELEQAVKAMPPATVSCIESSVAQPEDFNFSTTIPKVASKSLLFCTGDRYRKQPAEKMDLVCASVGMICDSLVGSNTSFGMPCILKKKETIRARTKSLVFQAKVIASVKNAFMDLKDRLAEPCCHGDTNCKQLFTSVPLEILDSNTPELTLYYLPHKIAFSRDIVYNLVTLGVIQGVMKHELGHACQASRAIAEGKTNPFILPIIENGSPRNPSRCDDAKEGEEEIIRSLGKNLGGCITNKIREYNKRQEEKSCVNMALFEASAEVMFRREVSDLFELASFCGTGTDDEHIGADVYRDCLHPHWYEKMRTDFCGDEE